MSELQPRGDDLEQLVQAARARTPARVFVGRAGPGYRTATQLALRRDHAAALDAVHAELDPIADFGSDFVSRWQLFLVQSQADSKAEYLIRPDRASAESARRHREGVPRGADLQRVIGDGLSAAAVVAQVPRLLPRLDEEARRRGWSFGRPFAIKHCRVGVMNDVGDLLDPVVVVLLIGERPGLATAESLSAYLAFRPRPGDTDARRNLISNIHARGVPVEAAAPRVAALAEQMRAALASGVTVKEELPRPGIGMEDM